MRVRERRPCPFREAQAGVDGLALAERVNSRAAFFGAVPADDEFRGFSPVPIGMTRLPLFVSFLARWPV
jgi:hypothetical protein